MFLDAKTTACHSAIIGSRITSTGHAHSQYLVHYTLGATEQTAVSLRHTHNYKHRLHTHSDPNIIYKIIKKEEKKAPLHLLALDVLLSLLVAVGRRQITRSLDLDMGHHGLVAVEDPCDLFERGSLGLDID